MRVLSCLCLLAGLAAAETERPNADNRPAANPALKGHDPNGGVGKRLFVVPVDQEIELGLAAFVERVLSQATPNDVILLKIKTFGGRVDAAVRIRDALLDSSAPTVAYIDRRAISAGALIALACDTIIMSEGASMGAATPVTQGQDGQMQATSEKVVSYMRAEMRATAEAKGRRADIAEAMVDRDIEVKGVSEKGKLLTLTTDKALELNIADAKAANIEDSIAMLNLGQAERVNMETHWGEKVSRLLTSSTVSGLLMTVGLLGLLLELYSPGFGVGGLIGLTCLGLFFFGQYAAQLAGWEEALLFVLGTALLMVELFVLPGFGIAGIAGIGCLLASMVMAMIELELPLDVSFELGYAQQAFTSALIRLAIALGALMVGAFLLGKYFPKSRFGGWLVFTPAMPDGTPLEDADSPHLGGALPSSNDVLMGQQGRTITVLRPTGVAAFGEQRVHVVTEGEFIDADTPVLVTHVDGYRIVVKPQPSSDGLKG